MSVRIEAADDILLSDRLNSDCPTISPSEETFDRKRLDIIVSGGVGPPEKAGETVEDPLQKGIDLLKIGHFTEATVFFQSAIQSNPKNAKACYFLAVALIQTSQQKRALPYLQRAIRLQPNAIQAYAVLGILYLQLGNSSQAIATLKQALVIKPDDTIASYNLGNVYLTLNQFDKASEQYWNVIHNNPRFLPAYVNLGVALVKSDQVSLGLSIWEDGLKLNPDNELLQYHVGLVHFWRGKLPEALKYFEAGYKINPRDADLTLAFAKTLNQLGRTSEAETKIQEVLKLAPDSIEASLEWGSMLAQNERWDEARMPLMKVVSQQPNNQKAHATLAIVFYKSGDLVKAAQEWRTILALEPANSIVRTNYANVLFKLGDFAGTVFHLEQAIRLNDRSWPGKHLLAEVLWAQGRRDESTIVWKEIAQKQPRDWVAHYNIGNFYAQRGEWHKAVEWLEKAKSLNPKNVQIDQATKKAREYWLARNKNEVVSGFPSGILIALPGQFSTLDKASMEKAKKMVESGEVPPSPRLWKELGENLMLTNPSAALVFFDRALKLEDKLASTTVNSVPPGDTVEQELEMQDQISTFESLGDVRFNLGQYDQAIQAYTRAQELHRTLSQNKGIQTEFKPAMLKLDRKIGEAKAKKREFLELQKKGSDKPWYLEQKKTGVTIFEW